MSTNGVTHLNTYSATVLRAAKKEENDPFRSGKGEKKTNFSKRRKKSYFKAASRGRCLPTSIRRARSASVPAEHPGCTRP
jgi:hypothetical protein